MATQDHDDLLELLRQSRQYLMQQKELFGDDALDGVKPPSRRKGAEAEGAGVVASNRSAVGTGDAAGNKSPADARGAGAPPRGQTPVVMKAPAPAVVSTANAPAAGPGTTPSPFDYPDEPWVKAVSLAELNATICNCLKCALGPTRTKFVFGVGDPNADVMFIGEGPGADEDSKGEPFVGRAGQLLNKIIEATGMKREQVYICNIVKCRPPNNRAPLPAEEQACTPYLMKQIELVKPKFIICLGRTAAQWLLQTADGLSAMRGRMHDFHGSKLIVTYHPAALLRNPEWKKPTWEDMKMFMTAYEATRGL